MQSSDLFAFLAQHSLIFEQLWYLSNSGTEIRNVLGKMLPIENCFTNSNYIGTSLAPPETATRIRIHDCIEVVSRIILWMQVNSIDKRSSKTVWIIPARPGGPASGFTSFKSWPGGLLIQTLRYADSLPLIDAECYSDLK